MSSSSSSSSSTTSSVGSAPPGGDKSIAEWIVVWGEMREEGADREVLLASIASFINRKSTDDLVNQLSKEQAIIIMEDFIGVKFGAAGLRNRASRLAAIRGALNEASEEVGLASEEDEEGEEEEAVQTEEEKKEDVPSTPSRPSRARKAKQAAADRKVAVGLRDRDLIQSFSRRVGKLKLAGEKKHSDKKEVGSKRKQSKPIPSERSSRARVDSDPSDSSDDDIESDSDESDSVRSQLVSGRFIQRLIGLWTWQLLLTRPALSRHMYKAEQNNNNNNCKSRIEKTTRGRRRE
jgi:hypothetical protein